MLLVLLLRTLLNCLKSRKYRPKQKCSMYINGYVKSEVNLGKGVRQLSDCFRMGYAGTIYPYNCVEEFLQGIKDFYYSKTHELEL